MSVDDLLRTAIGADALAASLRTEPPRRVLLVVRGNVGDAVMSTGAVAAIVERFAGAHVTLETSRHAMPLFDGFPGIDARRIRCDWWEKTTSVLWLRGTPAFDLAVILDDSRRRARMARWGGVRRIVGVREDDEDARFTASVRWNARGHDLFDSLRAVLALVDAPGSIQPRLVVDETVRSRARRVLRPTRNRVPVGLFVDAAREGKRWPIERFVDLAIRLERMGAGVLAFAGVRGSRLLQPMRARGIRTAEDLDHPLVLGEAIRGLAALVTNDTSAAHLADAVGTPAVVLYGPTSPVRYAPYGGNHRLLHAGFGCDLYLRRCDAIAAGGRCDGRCMRAIGVDQVFEAVTSIVHATVNGSTADC
jgi:ADP-heptose:LPS heptosyltransferase